MDTLFNDVIIFLFLNISTPVLKFIVGCCELKGKGSTDWRGGLIFRGKDMGRVGEENVLKRIISINWYACTKDIKHETVVDEIVCNPLL